MFHPLGFLLAKNLEMGCAQPKILWCVLLSNTTMSIPLYHERLYKAGCASMLQIP